ncbi:hypothetical protein EBZ80_23650 [bacterium]|nr:hypothetical protein [bacterium]
MVASSIAPDIPDIEMPQNCVRLYDGELPVCYEVVNGLAIVGGDIVIGTAGQMSALRENRKTGKANVIRRDFAKWPVRMPCSDTPGSPSCVKIPYEFDQSYLTRVELWQQIAGSVCRSITRH